MFSKNFILFILLFQLIIKIYFEIQNFVNKNIKFRLISLLNFLKELFPLLLYEQLKSP